MFTIILNNTTFTADNYYRTMSFVEDHFQGSININAIKSNNTTADIEALAPTKITSITLKKENEVVYTLTDINASIQSYDESFGGDRININLNISCD